MLSTRTRTLRCAVVGERTVVTVELELDQAVAQIKEAIMAKRDVVVPPIMFRLYLAKRGDDPTSGWLRTTHEDYEALVKEDADTVAAYLTVDTKMQASYSVEHYFPEQPDEHTQAIHMLLKLPTEERMEHFLKMIRRPWTPELKKKLVRPAPALPKSLPSPEATSSWIGRVARDSMAYLTTWMTEEKAEKTEKVRKMKDAGELGKKKAS